MIFGERQGVVLVLIEKRSGTRSFPDSETNDVIISKPK